MKRAPLVDPRAGFVWLPASSHSDPSKFLRRQRARIAEAEARRKAAANVIAIDKHKQAEAAESAVRG